MTHAFTKILVPTDFSGHADQALQYAEGLAAQFGASLHLLHVVDMPAVPTMLSSEIYAADLPGLQTQAVTDAEHRMGVYRAAFKTRGLGITTDVRIGHVAKVITECARERDADLIVMSTHGRTGLAHLTMGSVAERVVRLAPCPVLTIRARPSTAHQAA